MRFLCHPKTLCNSIRLLRKYRAIDYLPIDFGIMLGGGAFIQMSFLEKQMLNSPYETPGQHWELDSDGRPTNVIHVSRLPSALWTALPGTPTKSDRAQARMVVDHEELSTEATEFNPSPIVNDLLQELDVWQRLPNPLQWKVTPVTERLLQHWRAIRADEAQTIRPFFCQLEAVEAAICLAEVAPQIGKRGRRFLDCLAIANNFAARPDGSEPSTSTPEITRLALKLATGRERRPLWPC